MSLRNSRFRNWRNFVVYNKWTSLFVVSFSAFLALSAWISFEQMVAVQNKTRLRTRTAQMETAIKDRISAYVDALVHTRGLFMLHGTPSMANFEIYIRSLDIKDRYRGIRAIGFGQVVTTSEVPALVRRMKARGFSSFRIWPEDNESEDLQAPVTLIENVEENRVYTMGFDMMSDPARREAIEQAISTGTATLSKPVMLLQERRFGQREYGFIIYLPVYKTPTIPATVEERTSNVLGVIYASFKAQEFFTAIFGKSNPETEEINFEVLATILGVEGTPLSVYDRNPQLKSSMLALEEITHLQLLNTVWTIKYETTSKFLRKVDWLTPKIVGLACMAFSILIFLVITTIRDHIEVQDKNRKLIQETEQKSRRQSEIQRQLNEMSQYISAEIDFDELLKRVVLLAQYLTKTKYSSMLYRTNDGEGEIFLPYSSEEQVQGAINFESYNVKSLVGLFSGTHAIRSEEMGIEETLQLIRPSSPYKSWLAFPIFSRLGQLKAILLLVDDKPVQPDEDIMLLLQGLVAQVAIGIENALLFKKAEEASRAKSFFLANMSHEIRTPLGAIVGFSELLVNPNITENQKKDFIVNIRKNGEQLTRIIDDILDISKVEAGKVLIEKKVVHLESLLRQIQSIMNLRAREKGIQFYVETEGVLPSEFLTDEVRLKQILMNIIGNAIKFTDAGSVTLLCRTSSTSLDQKENFIDFIVIDTGCGISEAAQKDIFNPFSQVDPSLTRKYGGTGLGLSLSKKLAEQLGGTLSLVESHVGKGSTFMARIRYKKLEEDQVVKVSPAKPIVKAAPHENGHAPDLQGTKILLVEDSEDNQEIFKFYLESAGAEVALVEDGLSAVEQAGKDEFDLILMDIQVPGIDGKEATRRIRSQGYQRPIVALTAHAMMEEKQSCIDAGCNGQITKPVTGEQLISEISNYLGEGEAYL